MKKMILISMVAFLGALIVFNTEGTDFRFIGSALIDFRNETDQAITVIMNNNIEVHSVAAHDQATFTKANIGDAPIFHVKDSTGTALFSRHIDMVGAKASLVWDGNKF
ncbi:MAG: hypothetical protein EPN17_10120 [Methylobacter sp.]|nr:MAG: hypothetical protein EPN17_10120 [Methylobacter sp.]